MKKPIVTLVLAVIDFLLLAVIIVSAVISGFSKSDDKESSSRVRDKTVKEQTETSEESDRAYETTDMQETSQENETEATVESSSEVTVAESASSETAVEETSNPVPVYDTDELPKIKDFKWVTTEIQNGVCPDEAESLYFEEVLGGWKCYIIDDETGLERLANIHISGTWENLTLSIDWYYVRIGGKDGEVSEDNTPDSVFTGSVNDDGEIDVTGPGRVYLTDIYRIGDHQYAFGTIYWADGMTGGIYLVRP